MNPYHTKYESVTIPHFNIYTNHTIHHIITPTLYTTPTVPYQESERNRIIPHFNIFTNHTIPHIITYHTILIFTNLIFNTIPDYTTPQPHHTPLILVWRLCTLGVGIALRVRSHRMTNGCIGYWRDVMWIRLWREVGLRIMVRGHLHRMTNGCIGYWRDVMWIRLWREVGLRIMVRGHLLWSMLIRWGVGTRILILCEVGRMIRMITIPG